MNSESNWGTFPLLQLQAQCLLFLVLILAYLLFGPHQSTRKFLVVRGGHIYSSSVHMACGYRMGLFSMNSELNSEFFSGEAAVPAKFFLVLIRPIWYLGHKSAHEIFKWEGGGGGGGGGGGWCGGEVF